VISGDVLQGESGDCWICAENLGFEVKVDGRRAGYLQRPAEALDGEAAVSVVPPRSSRWRKDHVFDELKLVLKRSFSDINISPLVLVLKFLC